MIFPVFLIISRHDVLGTGPKKNYAAVQNPPVGAQGHTSGCYRGGCHIRTVAVFQWMMLGGIPGPFAGEHGCNSQSYPPVI